MQTSGILTLLHNALSSQRVEEFHIEVFEQL